MIKKLIPVVLALFGLVGGGAAGFWLRPAGDSPVEAADSAENSHGATAPPEAEGHADPAESHEEGSGPEYVKLNNQFIVPVLVEGRVASMVILSLNLEVQAGASEGIYAREPKLRDAFLQVLFDHANAGGFRGSFTDGSNLILLRRALLESAHSVLGDAVTDVLISDIARQDS